jgi:hypothetical protein
VSASSRIAMRGSVVAGILGGLILWTALPSAADSPWHIVPSPNKGPSWIYGLSALADSDAWAVGNYFEGRYEPLAEHWDGTSWTIVDTPDIASDSVLSDVVQVSGGEAWAVGTTNLQNHPTRSLILHWDGTGWALTKSPSPSKDPFYGENPLYAVDALPSGEAWAVGYRFTNTGYQALILHWDGNSWRTMDVPGAAYRKLTSVVALATDNVWATGYDFTFSSGYQPAALHWDGRRWRAVPPVQVPGGSGFLNGLTSTPSGRLWATGYTMQDGVPQPLFEHWDGAWSLVRSPRLGTGYNFLQAVEAIADDDVWAMGHRQVQHQYVTFAEHWDGARWTVVDTPSAPDGGNQVYALAAEPSGGLWAAGYVYPDDFSTIRTLVLRLEPTA